MLPRGRRFTVVLSFCIANMILGVWRVLTIAMLVAVIQMCCLLLFLVFLLRMIVTTNPAPSIIGFNRITAAVRKTKKCYSPGRARHGLTFRR